jgi:RES domain
VTSDASADAKHPVSTRQTLALPLPPAPTDLKGFPVWHVHSGTTLFRVTSSGHGPWWFSSDGAGRFDLAPPRGTCYLADDEMGALLEVLGPVAVVSADWAKRFSIWLLGLPDQTSAADTTVRAARGFGVTAELATMTPYDMPQRWASAFAAAGYQGVRYRVRHDPGGSRALALFGLAGERRRWPRGRRRDVDDDVLDRLADATGLRIATLPDAADLGELLD